jgi:4-diphosphocytidyl-2-C-methyl-D-erythritol kinase
MAGGEVDVKTWAKINLHLRIGPLAADGFHPLMSWMCGTGLYDSVSLRETGSSGIKIVSNHAEVPTDARNLIWRAIEAMAKAAQREPNLDVRLIKCVPMGGGLGGGSGNAAGTLMGLNRLWNLNWPTSKLSEIGAKLGSDVTFFLHGASSVCTGRGERVVPIPRPRPSQVILMFPEISMPTQAVYRKFDEMKLGTEKPIVEQPDWEKWSQLSAVGLLKNLVNDLELPAFALRPELGELLRATSQSIGRTVRMSGSGSTLFTLFDEEERAEAIAARVKISESTGLRADVFELGCPAVTVMKIA